MHTIIIYSYVLQIPQTIVATLASENDTQNILDSHIPKVPG